MVSVWIIKALLVQYVILAGACLYDRKPWMMVYWLGAVAIQIGILKGMQ